MYQPSFFPDPEPLPDENDPVEAVRRDAAAAAAAIPQTVFFGTSSWAFPGWRGIVYSRRISDNALSREGLREYARHPLLRTVGIDRSYYAPIPDADFWRYAEQLPPGFPCVIKAPATVTSLARIGPDGRSLPERNTDFLSVARVDEELLGPMTRSFTDHAGPVLLQFPPSPARVRLDSADFAARLDRFLEALPRHFEYAIEVREPALLTAEYARVLARHGAGHTYNYWTNMPRPVGQSVTVPVENAPFLMIRLLMAPGTRYEDRRDEMRPFNRLSAPDPSMRDEVVALTNQATRGGRRRVYILVNNKAEGSSPLTVAAIASQMAMQQGS
jgi:uncharacterized protein YecE (DUF72 family)